jgi:hypothetical protein
MRGIGWLASALALVAAVATPRAAAADTMDPALSRLVTDESCRTSGPGGGGAYYNPQSGFARCGIDHGAFAKLIAQYGAAIAPTAMHAARTTGFGGFELAFGANFTTIDKNAKYWQEGTQGPIDPSSKLASVRNKEPASMLQLYELKIRKGFPFGLELAANFGYLANTSIFTIGADVRMSLLEGFRTGIPAIFPEIAAGGSVRTITGTDQIQLTVVAVDGEISKPIPIAGSVVLTPYVAYQWMRIFGDSGLIDLTPNTDAVNLCHFQGTKTPAYGYDANSSKGPADGQPICTRGTSADFNNTAVFNPVRLTRHRLGGGLQLRFQMIRFGAHLMTDVVSPESANQGEDDVITENGKTVNKFKDVKRQFTFGFDLGAVF